MQSARYSMVSLFYISIEYKNIYFYFYFYRWYRLQIENKKCMYKKNK